MGKIRIIGGMQRGRKIVVPDMPTLRPTSDRMRETLFNWLGQDLETKTCLDLFAGSGILGIEAASRGAKWVDFIEAHSKTGRILQENLINLQITNAKVQIGKAETFLQKASGCYDIVFCDPPFFQSQIDQLLSLIKPFIHRDSIIYLETEKGITGFDGWQILREKKTQQASCRLLCLS